MPHVLTRCTLALGALPLLVSVAVAADQYIGGWVSTLDPANRIEMKRVDGQYLVDGREAVIYAGKPTAYRPKTYKAALQPDGSLRISFFTPQTFKVNPSSGTLQSKTHEYRRATVAP